MCGIFALLNNESNYTSGYIQEQFMKGRGRGPEFSTIKKVNFGAIFGFHRLAINGLNDESNQPLVIGDISLICNGEIYNYRELYALMNVQPITDSDCEVIVHLYVKYGIEQTLQMLDGVFAFVLCDTNTDNLESKIIVARDPYGVRPLYIMHKRVEVETKNDSIDFLETKNSTNLIAFASELKVLTYFCTNEYSIDHFQPGTYSTYSLPPKIITQWNQEIKNKVYHSCGFNSIMFQNQKEEKEEKEKEKDFQMIIEGIQKHLLHAVRKRVLVTERPIACLLSGGLDSSLITALVNEVCKEISDEKQLETFSIGLADSEDLKYARIVAAHLKTKHTEIVLTESDFLQSIPEVIRAIESYDTTTVRASIGNYLLGKYISENSDAKVIFNGDGSDELCGGYLYMHAAPDAIEFDKECRRLLKDIHAFDVLRSDKCISSHGLEPRTPFLDRSWVQYYLSINPSLRFHPGNNQCEKYLLRTAFSERYYSNCNDSELLPSSILWRKKEAFSDGVSKMNRSLYEIIQDHVKTLPSTAFQVPTNVNKKTQSDTLEKKYYRHLFEIWYPSFGNVVPYFWMPRYVEATDASARTLEIYKNESENA
uniref:asparagine synthase (glutamine-hydrolyzing) n=1 Tax=viral metagenome TaxID=1070528 RepID=A0A6C0BBN7_9ZZZZ